jgi:hypothetical protein
VLCEICKILKPFEDATLLVQREKNVSGNMLTTVTLDLTKYYITIFVSALLSSLSKRLCKYEEEDVYTTSSILDTRFKLLWSKPEDVDDITTDLKKKLFFIESVKSEDDEADSISPPAKKVKTDGIFSFLPRGTPKRKRHMSGSTQCIDTYIGEECDTSDANHLLYWKENENKFPILAKLATEYVSVHASSAPVERLFSIVGKVFRPYRIRMKDETFETLMMLKTLFNGYQDYSIKCNTQIHDRSLSWLGTYIQTLQ